MAASYIRHRSTRSQCLLDDPATLFDATVLPLHPAAGCHHPSCGANSCAQKAIIVGINVLVQMPQPDAYDLTHLVSLMAKVFNETQIEVVKGCAYEQNAEP
jgi:hypothetical protein